MRPYSHGENRNSNEPGASAVVLQGRVLVVDDGPENRLLLKIILGWLGLDVESANNGLDACRMAEQSLVAGQPFSLEIGERHITVAVEIPDSCFTDEMRQMVALRQGIQAEFLARLGIRAEVLYVAPGSTTAAGS